MFGGTIGKSIPYQEKQKRPVGFQSAVCNSGIRRELAQ
jgi:hypothetical protein